MTEHAARITAAAKQLNEAIDQATRDGLRVELTLRAQVRIPGPACTGVEVDIERVEKLGRYP